jgi:2-iminobutanoate/2-iminopropanoate deaminase
MKAIHTNNAPAAIGPYSQAIFHNGMMFVSGQIGLDPRTGELAEAFEDQVMLVMNNLKAILTDGGMGFAHVAKVSVFIRDMEHYLRFNEIYSRFFSEPFPAREVVEVSRLPKNAAIEISLIAMK